jgi:hypothetical protein
MKSKAFFVLLLLLGAAYSARAQSVLPSSFGGWVAAPATIIPARDLAIVAQDKADILREYGVSSAERSDYAQNGLTASVVLYKMTDPSAAFGAFTFLRGMNSMPITGAGNSAAYAAAGAQGRAILVIGNFVVDISSTGPRPADGDLKVLADSLFPSADRRPYPPLARFLPKNGLVKDSEVYVLGPRALAQVFPVEGKTAADWIGFDKSAEAIVAHYHLAGRPKDEDAVLVMAIYPTQQIAANQYNQVGRSLALNVEPAEANGRTAAYGARSAALIALLSGVDSREAASSFLNQIHYATDVTWNESSHDITDPSISTIVVGAIVDTGSIMLIALAAGLGFGGLRLLMKVVMPGRVFDQKDRVEILQLGLTSKPVKSEDFY